MSAYCGLPVRCELSLGNRVLDLMDGGQGFRIASLDLGYPSIRTDVTDSPEQSGTIDTTAFFAARAVTIAGTVVASASGSRTASLSLLAPYLDPSARPILTYQTDVDSEPRQLVLRAASLTAPLASLNVTAFTASWQAPSGLATGTEPGSASTAPSSLLVGGRTYAPGNGTPSAGTARGYNRVYPPITLPGGIVIVPDGDYPTPPTFQLWGPVSGATITVTDTDTGSAGSIYLQAGYTVPAGRYLTIDCGARTIVDDTGANVYGLALAGFAVWPVLVPGDRNAVAFNGQGVAGASRLNISWLPRWLV